MSAPAAVCCNQCGEAISEGSIAKTIAALQSGALASKSGEDAMQASSSSVASDFVVLDEWESVLTSENQSASAMGATAALAAKIIRITEDIAAGSADALGSFPICEECSHSLFLELDQSIVAAQEESVRLDTALREMAAEMGTFSSADAMESEMAALAAEEAELMKKLAEVDDERKSVAAQINAQKKHDAELRQMEERNWHEYNEYERTLEMIFEEKESLEKQIAVAEAHLERLKRTNVYNDTFHIWHNGPYGTINGFRLGVVDDFKETNAAYGQAALLLFSLAQRCRFSFNGYKVVPLGSFSKMQQIKGDTAKDLSLYGGSSSFDAAQIAFLNCVHQFSEYARAKDKEFRAPYAIHNDKIEGMPIVHKNNDAWIKALKCLLTNLKVLLFFVSKLYP